MSESSNNLIRLSERSPEAMHYESADALEDAGACLKACDLPTCTLILIADRGAQGAFEFFMAGLDRAECMFLLERMKQKLLGI